MLKPFWANRPKLSAKLVLTSVFSVLIFTNVDAGLARGKGILKCVSFCKESTKFGFEEQTTNIYDYNTQISTSVLGGTSSEYSNLFLGAQVEISAISPCELQLQVTNVRIEDSQAEQRRAPVPGANDLVQQLERYPLRFSFQDGKIEHICSAEEDPIWVLNVKRGILSTLQNTMGSLSKEHTIHDVDVSGRCLTKYIPSAVLQDGTRQLLERSKDLKRCSQHHSHLSVLQSVPYTSNSPIQTIPLLSGIQVCSQSVVGKRLNHVDCKEVHTFQPFQNSESGAQTTVTQRLIFVAERNVVNTGAFRMRKGSLVLETQGQPETRENDITQLLALLEKLELESFPKVQSRTPEHFIDLVQELRFAKYDVLKTLLDRAPGQTGKQHMLDALPLVGTAPSITLMRELFSENKLSEDQAQIWLSSLTFIKNPTIEMISAVRNLLDNEPRNQVLLSVSSMVHAYCKANDDCSEGNSVVENTLTRLFSLIGINCRMKTGGREELTSTIVALKAIGNAGALPKDNSKGINTLTKCFEETSNPTEIRLTAVQAFRRFPCRIYKHDSIVTLLKNTKEDTEVRIQAYLASMKCPDRTLVKTIEEMLTSEDVNQVGSFIWTHLANLQETSSPDKQAIKELVSNNFLQSKFATDVRKFSRNYEGTMYWAQENVGVSGDSNVVFVPDSFVPRSAMLNLTCHLFGESVNLLEFGVRVHSLEQLLEPLFGPTGYFPDQTINEALHTMRVKRDVVSNEIPRLDSIYSQASYGSERLPGGSIYSRVFGNELLYKNFEISHTTAAPSVIDEAGVNWLDITHLFDNLRAGKSTEFTKSTILMDASYTVSTSAGIPLSLGVQSAATVALTANGKIDLGNFWENREIEIKGMLRPSAAIQIHGTLSVHLGKLDSKIKSGLKLQNTMHSSTGSEARIMLKGSKIAHLSISLPENKQEIFESRSQLLILHPSGNTEIIPPNVLESKEKLCTPQLMSTLLGIQICGESNFPANQTFSIFSPASIALYAEKTDVFKNYEFDYKWEEDEGKADISMIFSTPGSKINRRLAAEFHFDKDLGTLDTMLEIPGKYFRANGKLASKDQGMEIHLKSGEQDVLHFNTAVQHRGTRVEPKIQLQVFSRPIFEIDGFVDLMNIAEQGGQANLDLTLMHLTANPIRLTGNTIHEGETFTSNLAVQSYLLSGDISSQIKIKPNTLGTKAEIKYSYKKADLKTINFGARFLKTKKAQVNRYLATVNCEISDIPAGYQFEWETQTSPGYCENKVKYLLGQSLWEGKSLYKQFGSREQEETQIQLALTGPRKSIDYNINYHHYSNETGVWTSFLARKDSKNELNAHYRYGNEGNMPLSKRYLDTAITWPGHKYGWLSQIKEVKRGEFESELKITVNQRPEIKGTASSRHIATTRSMEQTIEFRLLGLLSAVFSGQATISASDKIRHLGGQFQIQGNPDLNGRWGSSLDYKLVKKNNVKVEGKVSLNEKNYSLEMSWRKAKNGDRFGVIDLKLARRIRLESQLKGSIAQKMIAALTLYPDRDANMSSKIVLKAILNSKSGVVGLDYFGQITTLAGNFGENKFQIGAEHMRKMIFNLTIIAPHWEGKHVDFSINLKTPAEGLNEIGVSIRHQLTPDNVLDVEIRTHADDKQMSLALRGQQTDSEHRSTIIAEISGQPRIEGNVNVGFSRDARSVELSGSIGARSTFFRIENKRIINGFMVRMDFTGCSGTPPISLDLKHQTLDETSTVLLIDWTPDDAVPRLVSLEIVAEAAPWNYKFEFASPFKNLEKLDGVLSWKANGTSHNMDLRVNLPFILQLPVRVSADFYSQNYNFKHQVSASWPFQNKLRTARGSTEGRISKSDEALITATIAIPDHNFEAKLQRLNLDNRVTSQLELNYNADRIAFETQWRRENQEITASVSGEWPSQPNTGFNLHYDQKTRSGTLDVTQSQVSLIKITSGHSFKSCLDWDMSLILESQLEWFPVGQIVSSNHIKLDVGTIHHKSALGITPKYFKFQNGDDSKKMFLMLDVLEAGEDIQGTLRWDDQEIKLLGIHNHDGNQRKLNLELTSQLFDTIKVTGVLRTGDRGIGISLKTSVKENSVFDLKSDVSSYQNKISGEFDLNIPSIHQIESKVTLDWNDNSVEIVLKENKNYYINLFVSAQVLSTRGHALVDIQTKLHPLLHKFKIDLKYQLEAGKFQLDGKYFNKGAEASITGLGIFTDSKTSCHLSIDGPKKFVGEIEISDWKKLNGYISIDNIKLAGINMLYTVDLEKEEFSMGKHIIVTDVFVGKSTYQVTASAGIGLDRIVFTLSTPFEGWEEFQLSGKFKLEQFDKVISITASKKSEEYKLNWKLQAAGENSVSEIKIETPIPGLTTASAQVKRSFGAALVNTLTLTLEAQTMSITSNWSPEKSEFKVETPFPLLETASLSWKLTEEPEKHIQVAISYNDFELEGGLKTLPGILDANVSLFASQKYDIEFSYDITKDYKAKASITLEGKKYDIGGFVLMSDGDIQAGIYTPFPGMEGISGKLAYKKPENDGGHGLGLEWKLNGQTNRADFQMLVKPGLIELNCKTPFNPWNEVSLKIEANKDQNRNALDVKLERGDGKFVEWSSEIEHVGGNLTDLSKPMTGLIRLGVRANLTSKVEDFKLHGKYNRQRHDHELSASCNLFGEVIEGKAKVQIEKTSVLHIDIDAEISAPGFGIRQSSVDAFLHLDTSQESTLRAQINHNGKEHKVESTFKIESYTVQLHLETSFQTISRLLINGQYKSDGRLVAMAQVNDKKLEVNGQVLWGGIQRTKLVFDANTPFDGFKSTYFEAESKLVGKRGTVTFLFQNDYIRYMGKADGEFHTTSGYFTTQINSPIKNLEQVVALLQYNMTGIHVKLDRNTKEEVKGLIALKDDGLEVNLLSKIPGYLVNTKSVFDWGKSSMGGQANFEAGILGQRLRFKTNIKGIRSVDIEIGTSLRNYEKINVQWNLEGNSVSGNGRASYSIPKIGQRSIRGSWKTDDPKRFKAELWINGTSFLQEKGLALQYSLTTGKVGNGKLDGSLTYVLDKRIQEITITTALRRVGKSNTLDVLLRTPFDPFKEILLTGTLVSKPEMSLDMILTHNQMKLLSTSANLFVSPASSKLKLSFNAPLICEPFSMNSAYNLTTSDKTLELSFLQNQYQITIKTLAVVPENSQEIEVRMTVDSNVPSVTVSASGSLKASYKHEHDGNHQVALSIDSEHTGNWKVIASFRSPPNLIIKLTLDSPVPYIVPSIQVETKWIGNMKEGFNSEFVVRVQKQEELKIVLISGPQKFLIAFKSNVAGYEDLSLEGRLDSINGYQMSVEVNAGGERVSLTADLSPPLKSLAGSGSIVLWSSWRKIPSGSLDVRMSENGDLEMTGIWGERNVGIRGNLKSGSHASLVKSGNIDLTFILDSQDQFQVRSNYYFNKPQLSLNVTSGVYKLEFFIHSDSKLHAISTKVQWNKENGIAKFYTQSRAGQFTAKISSPWTDSLEINGNHVMSQEVHSAKGTIIYSGIESSLEAALKVKSDSFDAHVNVDVPVLNQKVNAVINVNKTNDQNIEGLVDLRMMERHMAIRGILSTGYQKSRKTEEKTLQLSILFPDSQYSDISTEIVIKKPVDNFGSLAIDASIHLPTGVSKIKFQYELPIYGSNKLTTELALNSPLLTSGPFSGSINADIHGSDNINATFTYGENDLRLTWSLNEDFLVSTFVYLPSLYPDSHPFSFETEGSARFPDKLALHIRATYEKHSLASDASFIQIKDGFTSKIFIQAPYIFHDKQEFNFKLTRIDGGNFITELTGRNGRSAVLLISELVIQENDVSLTYKISGLYGAHYVQLVGHREGNTFLGEMNAESLALLTGKKIVVSGRLDVLPNGFETKVECRTRKALHTASLKASLSSEQGEFALKANSPDMTPITLDFNYKLGNTYWFIKTEGNLAGQKHLFEVVLDRENWELQVTLSCPTLSSEPLSVHLKSTLGGRDIGLLGDLRMPGDHWRVEGTIRLVQIDDIELKFELITPYEQLERVTVGVKLDPDEIRLELVTPWASLPSIVLSSTGIPLFEELDWKNMNAEVLVGLPWITYTGAVVIILPTQTASGEFRIMLQQTVKDSEPQTFEVAVQMSSFEKFNTQMDAPVLLKAEIKTPFKNFRTFAWELGGNMQWKNWAEIKLSGHMNDKEISLTSGIRTEADNQKFSIELITPFEEHERYAFVGRIQKLEEIGFGRSIQVEFYHPNWDKPLNFEIDYNFRFDGLSSLEGELSIKAPGLEIPPIVLMVTSTLKDMTYSGGIESSWGEHRPSLKISAGQTGNKWMASAEVIPGFEDEETGYHGSFEFGFLDLTGNKSVIFDFQLNREQLLGFKLNLLHESNIIEAELALKTPFETVNSASALIRISPLIPPRGAISLERILRTLDISIEASFNGRKLGQLELINRNGRSSISFVNPFRPVSFAITYDRRPMQLRIYSEVCWDLLNQEQNTVGIELILNRRSGGVDVNLKLLAGDRGSLDGFVSLLQTLTRADYNAKLKWNAPALNQSMQVGFGLLLNDVSDEGKNKYDVIVRLDIPWRCIEIESRVQSGDKDFSRLVMLKWDALRSPHKRIGVRFAREQIVSWRSHSEKHAVTIVHSGLPHDLTFTIEKSYNDNKMGITEFTLQPNSFPQDKFTVRISKADLNGEGIQIIFILPSINLDVNMILRRSATKSSIHISHMDIQGERQVFHAEIIHETDLTKVDIRRGLEGNAEQVFNMQCNPKEDVHVIYLRVAALTFDASVEKNLPLARANLAFDYGRKLSLVAGLPHKKEMTFKILRNELGMNINEVLMSLKLNASHVLSSRVHWRPELFSDLRRLSVRIPNSIKSYFVNGLPKVAGHVNDEVEERLARLDPGISRMIDNIKDYTVEEISIFAGELQHVVEFLGNLPLNNTYFNFDVNVGQWINFSLKGIQQIGVKISKFTEKSSAAIVKHFTKIYNQFTRLWDRSYGKFENLIMPLWEQGENAIAQFWNDTLNKMADIISKFQFVCDTVTNVMQGNLDALEKQMNGIGFISELRRIGSQFLTWFQELPGTGQITTLFIESIWHPLEHYSKPLFIALNKIVEERNLLAILDIPPLPYVRYVTNKLTSIFKGLWKIVEAEQKIRDVFRQIFHILDSIMKRHIPTATMIWDIKKGQVEYHQPLNLIDWEDFTQMPTLRVSEDDEIDGRLITDFYFSVHDTLRRAQPFIDINIRQVLPPFESHAIIAGDHHYYTFDQKYYRFAGECSYVLAADLLHQNFTILVNYQNQGGEILRKSLSIVSGDKIIELDTRTFKVTLQGRKMELPLEEGPTFVRRQPTGLEVFDTRGFQIRCTKYPSVCMISVSGWYFGKLGGLLGTYDNEGSNDFKTPDGIITDVANFAHSWRVGSNSEQCRMKVFAKNTTSSSYANDICGELLLNPTSPFRPCFGTVDPTEFMEMCKYDTQENLNSPFRRESSCTAIGAYVLECQKQKIDLWMPPSCVQCELEDGTLMASGGNVTISADSPKKPKNSTDVVLLLEEALSLYKYNINDIINKLDVALEAQGLTQNRYAIVRYGGKGSHRTPHIRTQAGQVWVHNTLRKFSHDPGMDGDGGGDLYEAIEYSATIGYRAGVAKVMVAVIADGENCGDHERYSDALTLLIENDFRLHILTPKDFILRNLKKSEDGRDVFGVDLDGFYNARHSRRATFEADKTMKQHIVPAKDFCTPLAMETNGTIFNLKHVHRTTAKKFIDVWSRRVAKTSHPSECQYCECVPDKNGGALLMCNQCVSPHLKKFLDDWEKYELQDSGEQQGLPGDYDAY